MTHSPTPDVSEDIFNLIDIDCINMRSLNVARKPRKLQTATQHHVPVEKFAWRHGLSPFLLRATALVAKVLFVAEVDRLRMFASSFEGKFPDKNSTSNIYK